MNKHTKKAIQDTEEYEAWGATIGVMFKLGMSHDVITFKPNTSEVEKIDYDVVKELAKGTYYSDGSLGYPWLEGAKWSQVNWEEYINHALETESGKKAFEKNLGDIKAERKKYAETHKKEWEEQKYLLPLYIRGLEKIMDKDVEPKLSMQTYHNDFRHSVITEFLKNSLIFSRDFEKVWLNGYIELSPKINLHSVDLSQKFEEEFAEFNKEVASFKEKNEYFHPSAVLELKILEWFVQQDKVKQHIEEVKQYVAKIKSAKEKIKELQKEIDDITSECSLMNFNNKRLDCDASYTDNFNNIIDQTAEDRLEEEEPLDINNFDGHKNIIGLDESVEE